MHKRFYVADIGNTQTKIAEVNDNQLSNIQINNNTNFSDIKIDTEELSKLIVSSVNPRIADKIRNFKQFSVHEIGKEIEIPVKNLTEKPQQTGIDRLVNVFAASKLHTGENTIVVDAGTAITYDVCSTKGDFLGGVIQAGYHLQLQAMHDHTSELPPVDCKKLENISALGKTTEEAMLASVKFGIPGSVLSIIQAICVDLRKRMKEIQIIFTGGAGEFIYKNLKDKITSYYSSDLTLKGLMYLGLELEI